MSANSKRRAVLDSDSASGSGYDSCSHRVNWSNNNEFLFTCLLYVIGLGNFVRFPEAVFLNGGGKLLMLMLITSQRLLMTSCSAVVGSFILCYVIVLVLVGVPIFYLELALGQYASLGPITMWRVSPLFKGTPVFSVSSFNFATCKAVCFLPCFTNAILGIMIISLLQ